MSAAGHETESLLNVLGFEDIRFQWLDNSLLDVIVNELINDLGKKIKVKEKLERSFLNSHLDFF